MHCFVHGHAKRDHQYSIVRCSDTVYPQVTSARARPATHLVVTEMENTALDTVYSAKVSPQTYRTVAGVFAFKEIYSFKKEYGDNGALDIITVMQNDLTG